MLNPFPSLLMFSFFVPTLIRLTVAVVFAYQAIHHFKNKRAVAEEVDAKISWLSHEGAVWGVGLLILAELAIAIALFVGAWTQFAALFAIIGFAKLAFLKKKFPSYAPLSSLAYTLLIVMSITLLVSGAGAFAFDLPL